MSGARPCPNIKTVFRGMRISIIKIRRSWDSLIFIKGHYAGKTVSLYMYWDSPQMSPIHSLLYFPYSSTLLHCISMTSHERHGVSNHRQLYCWFNRLFMLTSSKMSKLRISAFQVLCERSPPVIGANPHKGPSNAKSSSIWWQALGQSRVYPSGSELKYGYGHYNH